MSKKRLLVVIAVLGTLLVVGQVVWAANNDSKKQEPTQVSQAEHAQHHPTAQASKADAKQTSEQAPQGNMQDQMKTMGSGNMDEMMQMMQTPEGKQMMEKCLETLKQQPAASQ
ncbi:hypothetical protein [Paenibacillus sp. URB8-2]|uniref:hypothetical protein n=1 Tax=Paenibacillus sp. URB8-2 TaxID=2741301 RepID=UPI0015BC353F|nr:hypothetical protein [Paenibacillus sp. URB8-2]BCG60395.1 hypothetical protein PUR_38200 [Paenibacillus sp. URB8-2]